MYCILPMNRLTSMEINIQDNHCQSVDKSDDQNTLTMKAKIKRFYYSRSPAWKGTCLATTFTCLSITIGVVVVCLTAPREKNIVCEFTFKPSVQSETGYNSHPHHGAAADFNHDGNQDIIVANTGTDDLSLFLGYGNGSFTDEISYSLPDRSQPYAVNTGDFNQDNFYDVAVANYGTNCIGILFGDGLGNFTDQIAFSLGAARPLYLSVAHINQDNQLDIAVINSGTFTLIILAGYNNGLFRIETIIPMGYDSFPSSLIIADFNNDKQFDIAVVNTITNYLVLLLANQNGTFTNIQYPTGKNSHPKSLAVGDFNKDGQLDIVVAQSGTNNIGIYFPYDNATQYNRTLLEITDFQPSFIRVADFDNDTNLDIAVISSVTNQLNVFKGGSYGEFSLIRSYFLGDQSNPSSIIVADFDNDHKMDIAVTNNGTNTITIFTKYTIYPTAQQVTYNTKSNSGAYKVAVGDFDNDDFLDIVLANSNSSTIDIFFNNGDGRFMSPVTYKTLTDANEQTVAIGDFNHDNYLDLVVAMSQRNQILIFIGDEDGIFTNEDVYSTGVGSSPEWVSTGHLNNDTHLDIVVANANLNNIGIFFGYGDGSFMTIKMISLENGAGPTCVRIADMNNDDISDIITANIEIDSISILIGYGNGTFRTPISISAQNTNPVFIAIGDVNGDHLLDIMFNSLTTSNVGVFLGYGNGTVGNLTKYSTGDGSGTYGISLVDFNNDTFLDIAVVNELDDNMGIFIGLGNGSFHSQKTFSTGIQSLPYGIDFGDFNNDKQVDIVVCNYATDNIGIFLVHYDESFTQEISYSTGSGPHPYSIAITDLNNDNQSDLVVANSGDDSIEILSGYHGRTFAKKITYSTGFNSRPQFVITADFNQDNRQDIIVSNTLTNTVNLFYNLGNDTFDTPISLFTGDQSSPRSLAVGDFNNDNRTDFVVAKYGLDQIDVYISYNYVTFVNYTLYRSAVVPLLHHVVTGDFNNDHHLDLIVSDENGGTLAVYLGYGNRTFAKALVYSTGGDSSPYILAVGHLNKDKNLDIVVIYSESSNITVLLGIGNGTFGNQTDYIVDGSSIPTSIALGDFNNDTITDIVVVYSATNSVAFLLGNGNGTFIIEPLYKLPSGSSPVFVTVNDMNNDLIQDIIIANQMAPYIGIFSRTANGTLKNIGSYRLNKNAQPPAVVTGDLNNDGWMDLAVPEYYYNGVSIYMGTSNHTLEFKYVYRLPIGIFFTSIYASDINNDTYLDIAVVCIRESGMIYILFGFGDGNFTAPTYYPNAPYSFSTSLAIADFDNDGRIDFAVSNYKKGNIFLMFQKSYQQFVSPWSFSTGTDSSPVFVATGHFNNDHHMDIVVANSAKNNIGIHVGLGDGTFVDQITYSTDTNFQPSAIAIGDFNNDTHLDLAVTDTNGNSIHILLGHPNGTFSYGLIYSTGLISAPSSIASMDLNKDNQLDLVVATFGANKVLVFLGAGNGTFKDALSYSMNYNARPQSVAIGDVNNDGLLDIAVANSKADYVEILLRPCS